MERNKKGIIRMDNPFFINVKFQLIFLLEQQQEQL